MNDVLSVFSSAIRMGLPLALAALGGVFSARAGIVAMGLEGMMLVGSFFAAWVSDLTQNAWLGVLAGMAAGMLLSLLIGLLVNRYKVDHVICGIGINTFALGITTLFLQFIWGNRGKSINVPTLPSINLPILGASSPLLLCTLVLAGASFWLIYKSRYGLHLRMTGEDPVAAMTLGIPIYRVKTIALAITGLLTGLAGAYLSIDQLDMFVRNMTAGRGYIALSIDILGRYHPLGILGGSLVYGVADALQIYLQRYAVPGQLLKMIPYAVTLLIMIVGVRYVRAPASLGRNIEDKGD